MFDIFGSTTAPAGCHSRYGCPREKTNKEIFEELKLRKGECVEDPKVEAVANVRDFVLAPDTGLPTMQFTGILMIGLSIVMLLSVVLKGKSIKM